LFVNFVWWRR